MQMKMKSKTKCDDDNLNGNHGSVRTNVEKTGQVATTETNLNSMEISSPCNSGNGIENPVIDTNEVCISSANDVIENETTATDSKKEKRRSREASHVNPHEKQQKKKKITKKTIDPEVLFETSWICMECKEAECAMNPDADELIICDGPCQRLFHYPCAGLEKLPEADDSFICTDCSNAKHSCAFCQNYGKDDEDVFKCDKKDCGLFFHESCLAMHNIEVKIVESTVKQNGSFEIDQCTNADDEGISTGKRVFVCPSHYCWTCVHTDIKEQNENVDSSCKHLNVPQSIIGYSTSSRKRGKNQVKSTAFQTKKGEKFFRCLECPISYHISCIPPSAKFHELAVICHEHAGRCKLPDLDQESSVQCKIEEEINRKFNKTNIKPKRSKKMSRARDGNPFFPSLQGGTATSFETTLLMKFQEKLDDFIDSNLCFCLPCDLKEEVHLIPPMYKHIQSNQYDPINRPQKVSSSGLEICECVGFCGDDCLNRSLYVECYGEGPNSKKQSNCNVGLDCGNRLFTQRKFAKCKLKREEGRGWGLTVLENVKRGELIIEYVGEIIDAETKEKRLIEWTKEHPNDPNFYIMALQTGWFIDAREKANLSRFINHSCEPNSMIVPINVMGRIRCGIRAIRDIVANEFISYDYHFDTRQRDKFVCRCGALKCRGSMQAGKSGSDESTRQVKKTKIEIFNEAKASFELDKKFLNDYYEDSKQRSSLVKETLPGVEKDIKDELVANGPQEKDKERARSARIFLCRNTAIGADFGERFARLDRRK